MRWRVLASLSLLAALTVGSVPVRAASEMPVVESAALGVSRRLPWSELVRVEDPFEGNFVGVFDRNYFFQRFQNISARVEVQSLWSRESVRLLLVVRDRDCIGTSLGSGPFYSRCSGIDGARNVAELLLRVEKETFQVAGENGTFPVDDDLAQALQDAPASNIDIRLVTEGGEIVDSEIGQETVKAWRTIYAL